MAMEKRANAPKEAEILVDSLTFEKGDRFALDDSIWIVTEVRKDGNVEMIRIASHKGDDEMYLVDSLRKLIREGSDTFQMLEPMEHMKNARTDEENED